MKANWAHNKVCTLKQYVKLQQLARVLLPFYTSTFIPLTEAAIAVFSLDSNSPANFGFDVTVLCSEGTPPN